MFRPRIIPVLLLKQSSLVKSIKFRDHKYIGDPLNAVRIFNEMKADELMLLDIGASKDGRLIPVDIVRDVGGVAFMPLAVGGGIKSVADIRSVIRAGAEKVVIGTHAARNPEFIKEASETFGSSSIVVCIDVKRRALRGPRTFVMGGSKATAFSPVEFAQLMQDKGAGELVVQSIDRDGTMGGYDVELIKTVSEAVHLPVIALGGAGKEEDLREAHKDGHANALAAGSLFVYQGKKRGVLINYSVNNKSIFE